MKHIVSYINESMIPEIAQTLIKKLRSAGVDSDIEEHGNKSELPILNNLVSLVWNNGKSVERWPRCLYPTSQFENEPVYITILDNLLKYVNLSKLWSNLINNGLVEATNGKTAQWGTWKFAIRSDNDVKILMKALKNIT